MPGTVSPSPYHPIHPLEVNDKRHREENGSDLSQSIPPAKRVRLGASPLDPRTQGQLPAPQTVAEDPFQQVLEFPMQQPEAENTEEPTFTSPVDDSVDYRFVEPQNLHEQLSIQAALFYPRAHYYALLGENPPRTSEGSYSAQYMQLLTELEQNWVEPDRVPPLADVGIWKYSFNLVPTPDLPDWVLEHMIYPTAGAADARTQGLFENESAPTAPDSSTQSSSWNDDLFEDF